MKKKKITPLKKNSPLSKKEFYIKNKVYYRIIAFYRMRGVDKVQLEYYEHKTWKPETYLMSEKDFVKKFKKIEYEH
jgi:hypothetical protein